MSKTVQKFKAREKRKKGLSIKKIARLLGVSTSSVSNWCRDIVLTKEQLQVLENHARDPFYGRRAAYIQKVKKQTDQKIKRLNKAGIDMIGKLTKRELFLTGVALYWAEGFKKDSQAGLASLDPDMIKFFIKWLENCFGYKKSGLSFRITANISHQYRINEIKNFWSQTLVVPQSQFQKPFFQKNIWKKTYDNPDEYYGVLRVKVRKSKDFLRKIYGFIHGLKLNISKSEL